MRLTQRGYREFYGPHNRPSEQAIRRIIDHFRTNYSLHDTATATRQRNVCTEQAIAAVEESLNEDPEMSIRRRSQLLPLRGKFYAKFLVYFLTRYQGGHMPEIVFKTKMS